MYSSADDQAERASREYQDTRTGEQRKWDDLSYSVAEAVAKLRTITSGTQRMSWARDAKTLEAVSDMVRDMDREISALRIIGFREGDPVGKIPDLKPVENRTVEINPVPIRVVCEDVVIPIRKVP
jgi:hypothetical protein